MSGFDSRKVLQIFPSPSRLALGPTEPALQRGNGGGGLTTHLHLVSRSRMVELYLCSPIILMA
jgi:hypothetical protein